MRKDTYRIGDGTFAFSPAVFDSLLGHGAKGAARMRELAGAMHVSISSIKDWRRGTHAPSGFEKVEDIACWAHIDVADLLIESGDRTMDEKLTENQLDVLCVLWNQAYDFLDLCEETDHFVWPTTDLRCVPDSILHDIKVNPEDDKSRPTRDPICRGERYLRQASGPLRHHDRDRLRRGRRQMAARPGYDFRPA